MYICVDDNQSKLNDVSNVRYNQNVLIILDLL